MQCILHNKRLFLCRFLRRGVYIRAPPQVNLRIKSNFTAEDKMVKIYIKDANGRKIFVEVTEEQARVYREELRSEWRNTAKEKYHTVSLDNMAESGRDIADENSDIERLLLDNEQNEQTQILLKKLKAVFPELTYIQRRTVYKLFVKNKSKAEIAREEGISKAAISCRVSGIYKKLKKLLKKTVKLTLLFIEIYLMGER